ncbi:MAG TPA: YkvA family protein [Xanthobacteraceae bacterium]|nr:YkvA family protein [Xanthobacteraceae bacterium]
MRDSWPNFTALGRRVAADEAELRQKFWHKVKREAANIPLLEEALTAYYCAFDRNTPLYVKAVLVGALVYFAVPDDLIPDTLLGLADDAALLGVAFKLMSSHIKPEHRQAAQEAIARLRA